MPSLSPHSRDSVAELQSYLSDQLPPLLVAGAAMSLMRESHALVGQALHQWSLGQARIDPELSIGDLLYHCVRKIAMLGTLQLVDEHELREHLVALSKDILERCSGDDRARLEELLPRLTQELQAFFAPAAGLRHYRSSTHGEPSGPTTDKRSADHELARATRRLSVLISNLRTTLPKTGEGERSQRDQVLANVIATVAETARDTRELDRYVQELTRVGVSDSSLRGLLQALSTGLPNWAPVEHSREPQQPSRKAGAMQRLLTLQGATVGPDQWMPEVLRLAVDHFNAGELGRAISLLEVAARSAAERKVERHLVERMHRAVWPTVDVERLREIAIQVGNHPQLRKFLSFFADASPEALIGQLETAQTQEERHLCVALLRAHGDAGRGAALQLLSEATVAGIRADNRETVRNALYLLRTVPGAISDEETHRVMLLCTTLQPAPVLREVVEYLSGREITSSEPVLIHLLHTLDSDLLQPERASYPIEEVLRLLGTVSKALLRFGTPTARKAVVDSCLGQKAYRREALGRLADLGLQDLSGDPTLVARLVQELDRELPPRMLRRFMRPDEEAIFSLVMALAGTPTPDIARSLEEVAASFPGRRIGTAARDALERHRSRTVEPPSAGTPAFGGDIELFGLPTLLQTVEQNQLRGRLSLRDRAGIERAVMRFEDGRLVGCHNDALEGDAAFFQVFEDPFPGSFEFARLPAGTESETGTAVLPLLLEALRRYDELQTARSVVPEGASLRRAGVAPTACANELDDAFVIEVWQRVEAGASPKEIARATSSDDFRVWNLVAHWVEEGALVHGSSVPG